MENDKKIAVLIDADNVSDKYINIYLMNFQIMGHQLIKEFMETGQNHNLLHGRVYFLITLLLQFNNIIIQQVKIQQIQH